MPIDLPHRSRSPYLRFAVNRDAWIIGGDKAGKRTLTLEGKTIAFDVERTVRGWLSSYDGNTLRTFVPVEGLSGRMPATPEKGMRPALLVRAYAPKAFNSTAVFEMLSDTYSHRQFVARLYNECETQFGKGTVPLVVFGTSEEREWDDGRSTRLLSFEVKRWVARDQAFTTRPETNATKTATAGPRANGGDHV